MRDPIVAPCACRNRGFNTLVQRVIWKGPVTKVRLPVGDDGACDDDFDGRAEGGDFVAQGVCDDFDGAFGGGVCS
jgi:hypothetical protein